MKHADAQARRVRRDKLLNITEPTKLPPHPRPLSRRERGGSCGRSGKLGEFTCKLVTALLAFG
jgi:hypothetical protein